MTLQPATFEEFEREAARGNVVPVVRTVLADLQTPVRATDFLREYFRTRRLARRAGLAPMAGGAVGYVAYEAARWFEPVLERSLRVPGERDDAVFMLFRTVLAFDRVRQQMEITSVVFTEEAGGSRARLEELYDAAVGETAQVERLLSEGTASPPKIDEGRGVEDAGARWEANWTRDDFEAGVVRIKEHIAAGGCYQAVLSQRFHRRG